jgi:cytochrome c oxidase assembly protein subunit 11
MEKNKKTMFILTGVGVAMLGLGFASDPLYDTFCRITGYGGTPQIAEDNFSEVIDRTVTVKFDSNVASGLPWDFKPDQRSMDIKVGQSGLAYYTVRNESDVPLVGVASFNVTPIKAAPYFVKTDCFCFEEQTIQPGQELPLPVLFFVDSQLDEEKRLDDVKEITLSYTFFETDEEAQIATQSSGSNAEVELD